MTHTGIIDIDKLNHALDEIQKTIYNAEPIIRCKDCIHYDDWDTCDRFDEEMTVDDDGFCMWAERKEE